MWIIDRIAPLARSHSMSSCAGYHTPIEDEVVNSINVDGECDLLSDLGPLTPRGDSIGANQVITFQLCTLFPSNCKTFY